jgi:hypothetical protein
MVLYAETCDWYYEAEPAPAPLALTHPRRRERGCQ